jgi:hypothetical protein
MKFKGLVTSNKVRKNGERYEHREYPNLLVDDGKEYILDFLAGIKSWHLPGATGSGVEGLLTFTRYGAAGDSMFNNSSTERRDGIKGVPTGAICNYPMSSTILVSPEDSFLSNEVGQRIVLTARRVDQTVEFTGRFNVPGDIPSGTLIREFGLFLKATGPVQDPSFVENQKPSTVLCRTSLWGSGVCGGTGVYTDSPLVANDDVEIRWKLGEI